MTETTIDAEATEATESTDEVTPDSYTSESTTESFSSETPREIVTAPGAATGRRKEAIARVRIAPGSGNFTINGRTLEGYFPNKVHQQEVNEPFKVCELEGTYDVIATLHGGGISGQAGALRLGVARSLNGIDEEAFRKLLKKAGFLTRDPRAKERKKYGLKKARKAPQYSKR